MWLYFLEKPWEISKQLFGRKRGRSFELFTCNCGASPHCWWKTWTWEPPAHCPKKKKEIAVLPFVRPRKEGSEADNFSDSMYWFIYESCCKF